jgi:DNA polymerase-3 subunit delta'
VAFLKRSIDTGRSRQAYLFAGPAQIGKGLLATRFAQSVTCQSPEADGADCSSCSRIERGMHPDVRSIGLLSDDKSDTGRLRKRIGIAQIQALQHELTLQPYEAACRVMIIDGADLMTDEASNALLKTLEEPADRTVLILLAEDSNVMLPTVLSRCQVLQLRPVPAAEITLALIDDRGIDEEQAELFGRLSGGRPGWAIEAISNSELMQERAAKIEQLTAILGEDMPARLDRAAKLAVRFGSSREAVYQTLDAWQDWLRDSLYYATFDTPDGADRFVRNTDQREGLTRVSRETSTAQLASAIRALRDCKVQLDRNVNARLAIETALLAMPALAG